MHGRHLLTMWSIALETTTESDAPEEMGGGGREERKRQEVTKRGTHHDQTSILNKKSSHGQGTFGCLPMSAYS